MAANESVNSQPTELEAIVNRWLVDYYVSLAQELFEKELYADFIDVRTVIDSVLSRPCEITNDLHLKIEVLKFLSRINEDVSFGPEESTSPLESALIMLEVINQKASIPQQDFENVCTLIKEMIVVIFIKNNKFNEAKKVLNTHFPKQMVGKKAIFMGLIRKKSKTHEVIEQSNFHRFKNEILAFCRGLYPDETPFFHKAAEQLKHRRLRVADGGAAGPDEQEEPGPDEQEEPGPSSSPQINIGRLEMRAYVISPKARLMAAYRDLSPGLEERTFAQLEEEVEREGQDRIDIDISLCLSSAPTKDTNRDTEQDGLFQRAEGSPMEASPADQTPQMDAVPETQAGSRSKMPPSVQKNRQLLTLAQLVTEPDSQQSTAASQDLENEVRTEESQSPAVPSEKLLQSPLTDCEIAVPTRKLRRQSDRMCSRASTSMAELSADEEEETPVLSNRSIHRLSRQLSSDSEEDPQESPSSYRTTLQTPCKQLANDPLSKSRTSTPERISDRIGGETPQTRASGRRKATKSNQMPSDNDENQKSPVAPCKTLVQKPRKQLANSPPSRESDNTDEVCIVDSSLDSSPNLLPRQPSPRTSSTPHKNSAQGRSTSKWKTLFNNAKESKEIWDEDESYFTSDKDSGSHNESNISNSGHRKRRWTESETQKLKEGVRKFGEGNWSKIKSYYSFENRTNINLKDRWRTLKKSKMV
ncbi:telomeric repeat binding factor a isoform X2 [Sparus aurata]|uniref:telomeric repeat binding factor a isoform X2 n=1 Tax=Sparus aurata TaxID=8175 RepID=UPI0011C0F1BC|nr:telomeric repeat-binding factor 2 isoform X2 [Sparus aurata]